MLEIAVDFPDFPKGTEMDIGGVLVKNGETTKLDEDAELAFVSRHRVAVKDKLANSPNVKLTGTAKYGPSEVAKMFPAPVEPSDKEAPESDDKAGEK